MMSGMTMLFFPLRINALFGFVGGLLSFVLRAVAGAKS